MHYLLIQVLAKIMWVLPKMAQKYSLICSIQFYYPLLQLRWQKLELW